MLKTVLINIAILLGLFLLMEAAVRVFVPQIGPRGVDRSLIHTGRFGDTHGLARSASGSNYGVTTRTTPDGFIAFSLPENGDAGDTGDAGESSRVPWLLLGDSVTMPIGVKSDSSFAGRLAHAVSDSVRVLNSALIGYSAFDYLNVAGSIIGLGEHAPDRIILFWCLNDVYGGAPATSPGDATATAPVDQAGTEAADPAGNAATSRDDRRPDKPGTDRQTVRENLGPFLRFANRNIYLYQWLLATASDRGRVYFEYDRQFYQEDDPNFATAIDRIEIIRDMAEFNGIRFDLVMMPYEYQYRSGGFHPQDVLVSALQQKGIRAHDARSAFEGYPDITSLYMYGDGIHFSEKGHRVLWEWLRQRI